MRRIITAAASCLIVSVSFAQQTIDPPTLRDAAPKPTLINDVEKTQVVLHAASPFVEASSFGVVDIDITKIDVAKTAEVILPIVGVARGEEQTRMATTATGFIESLKTAGVSHIYVTGSTRSLTDGAPLVVVPCQNVPVVNALVSALVKAVPSEPKKKVVVGKNFVLAGSEGAVDRVLATETAERSDLILPLKNADRLDHAIVLSLPLESRESLSALWPDRLPPDSPIQLSPRSLAQDIHRVVVSFQLPPEPKVQAEIETTDAGAANRVKEALGRVLALSPNEMKAVEVAIDVDKVKLNASPQTLAKIVAKLTAPMRAKADLAQISNSLKMVGLAMHNYFSVNEHLPPRCLTDKQGTPLLSWRVTLLPFLEQKALYDQINLDQSFDSQANKKLGAVSIPALCENHEQDALTRFRVPVFPGSLWQGAGPPKTFRDVIDGTANTIAAIHAPRDAAINWADPKPWELSEDDPASDVFGDRAEVACLFLDGSVRIFSREELTNEKLKAMLTYAGREVIDR